jgi:hypothetical protein
MIIYFFKKHEIFLKTMKIVEFFLIIWGKLSELEPELEFLTAGAGAGAGQKWTGSATLFSSRIKLFNLRD